MKSNIIFDISRSLQAGLHFHIFGCHFISVSPGFVNQEFFQAVSAATSYLIVLLQFDMTSDFQKFLVYINTTAEREVHTQ